MRKITISLDPQYDPMIGRGRRFEYIGKYGTTHSGRRCFVGWVVKPGETKPICIWVYEDHKKVEVEYSTQFGNVEKLLGRNDLQREVKYFPHELKSLQ